MKFPRRLEDGTIVTTEDTKGMSIQEIIKEYSEFPCSEVKWRHTPFNTTASPYLPGFTLTVFGRIMTFAIDTGSSSNLVTSKLAKIWPEEYKGEETMLSKENRVMNTLGGNIIDAFEKEVDLEIPSDVSNVYLYDRFIVAPAFEKNVELKGYAYDFLLGTPFLMKHCVVIDYGRKMISFTAQSLNEFMKDRQARREQTSVPAKRFDESIPLKAEDIRELRIIFAKNDTELEQTIEQQTETNNGDAK